MMQNCLNDLGVIKNWCVPCKPRPAPVVKEHTWSLPQDTIKVNCDGACKGNPSITGIGAIFRDGRGDILTSDVEENWCQYQLSCRSVSYTGSHRNSYLEELVQVMDRIGLKRSY
ncbi:hypothetical protein IFM89_012929 [Coptis chinensis]|uniref:RNase H type-1 domain-containing protein n=1 Tax=Coptis chinensis TaxID=261450 RepID=A0A835HCT4_9MAGN|nr:hypothetical protein IFM89_012929 [Coptis chinensis]